MPCGKINSILQSPPLVNKLYFQCVGSSNTTISEHQIVIVKADWYGRGEQKAATLDLLFSGGLWLALVLHAVGVELYVSTDSAANVMQADRN